jgi:hypothetical protein
MFLIRFCFYFSLSFIILSFPVSKDKQVFDYLDGMAKPYTSKIHSKIFSTIDVTSKEVKEASKKVFNNTSADTIKRQHSSTEKKKVKLPQDNYTVEEREALLNILKNN